MDWLSFSSGQCDWGDEGRKKKEKEKKEKKSKKNPITGSMIKNVYADSW